MEHGVNRQRHQEALAVKGNGAGEPAHALQARVEQYKLYVEMADRISSRRLETHKFFGSLLAGILAVLSIALDKKVLGAAQNLALVGVGVVGVVLCVAWRGYIRSCSQLNSGKFAVIQRIEKGLPCQCYEWEWEVLGYGKDRSKYRPITVIEAWIPWVSAVPYLALAGLAVWRLVR